MQHHTLTSLAIVLILGAAAQWVAWALGLPSILLLLLAGFAVGPVLGVIQPDAIFGEMLLPFVSIAVAMILFEGGLTLRFSEIRETKGVVLRLVTIGAAITWALTAAAAVSLLGLDIRLAALLGAILTVTGPTVVLPMLRHIKPSRAVGSVLKWEGIVIDPIGAVLAVLVFDIILSGHVNLSAGRLVGDVLKTLLAGVSVGAISGVVLACALHKDWIPDHLRAIVASMFVLGAFAAANAIRGEAGLFAVTFMGVLLANQRYADMRHILEFKENLRVFLLSIVFILLSARVRVDDVRLVGPLVTAFIASLVLVVRPAAVLACTFGSALTMRERLFIAAMAPRGIVAAAVASVFALELEEAGYEPARLLVPIIFTTIVGTVAVYGLCGRAIARALKLSDTNPQGLLLVGGAQFGVEIAKALQNAGVCALLVDTNRATIAAAQTAGVAATQADILADDASEMLDLSGIGRMLALTSNHEVNVLAGQQFARLFGGAAVYQLASRRRPGASGPPEPQVVRRTLFSTDATAAALEDWLNQGAVVKSTKLTEIFDLTAYRKQHGDQALPLFVIDPAGRLTVVTADAAANPKPGDLLVSLVPPRIDAKPA